MLNLLVKESDFSLMTSIEKCNYIINLLSDNVKFSVACNVQWKIMWVQETFTDLEISIFTQMDEEGREEVYLHVCEQLQNVSKTIPYPKYNRISTDNYEEVLESVEVEPIFVK